MSDKMPGPDLDIANPDQLAETLESYRPWCRVFVRQAIYGKVGRRVDESDIIQTTWLDIVAKVKQFRGKTEPEFFGWLRTCLENNIRNTIRENLAAKRDVRREDEYSIEMDTASLHWFQQRTAESPSDHVIRGENALVLSSALEELPENQRRAVELRHLFGLKLSKVAEEMNRTPDAVVALIRRGIASLNRKLPNTTFT